MYRKHVILYTIILLALAGCSRYKEISLQHIAIDRFHMTGLSTAKVKVLATLDNPAGSKIKLTELNGTIKIKDKPIAVFHLDSALVFDARSLSEKEGTMHLKIQDMSVLFSGIIELDETLLDQLQLDIDALVKSRGIKRKLHWNDVPVKDFFTL